MKRPLAILTLFIGGLGLVACASGGGEGSAAPEPAPAPAAAPAAPEPKVPLVEVTAESLNVRAKPSTGGAVIGSLARGTQVKAPQAASDGWLYVQADWGLEGYVSAAYVRDAGTAPTAVAPSAAPVATTPAATEAPEAAESTPAPSGSLARVQEGMSEAQVIEILGPPTSQDSYTTGKSWIPYYYGSDTSRLDYKYEGVGRVVFSRNRYSGNAKVIRVDVDPSEDGH